MAHSGQRAIKGSTYKIERHCFDLHLDAFVEGLRVEFLFEPVEQLRLKNLLLQSLVFRSFLVALDKFNQFNYNLTRKSL